MTRREGSLQALLAARFRAQAQMMAALTDHPVLVGGGREDALGALLQELLPRRFEVLSGTVARLDGAGEPVRGGAQADILVADTLDFPVLLRSGSSAVVVPDAVRAVVEVKSGLARPPAGAAGGGAGDGDAGATETFLHALVQVGRLRLAIPDGGNGVCTALFSYGAPVYPRRLREWLELSLAARAAMPPGGADAAALSPPMLPDLIASLSGAVAQKTPARTYRFFRCPADGSKDGSAAVEALLLLLGAISANMPGDAAHVRRGFDFVRSYLKTDAAPAEGCPDLPL